MLVPAFISMGEFGRNSRSRSSAEKRSAHHTEVTLWSPSLAPVAKDAT